jgi:hypothetical protein
VAKKVAPTKGRGARRTQDVRELYEWTREQVIREINERMLAARIAEGMSEEGARSLVWDESEEGILRAFTRVVRCRPLRLVLRDLPAAEMAEAEQQRRFATEYNRYLLKCAALDLSSRPEGFEAGDEAYSLLRTLGIPFTEIAPGRVVFSRPDKAAMLAGLDELVEARNAMGNATAKHHGVRLEVRERATAEATEILRAFVEPMKRAQDFARSWARNLPPLDNPVETPALVALVLDLAKRAEEIPTKRRTERDRVVEALAVHPGIFWWRDGHPTAKDLAFAAILVGLRSEAVEKRCAKGERLGTANVIRAESTAMREAMRRFAERDSTYVATFKEVTGVR